MSTAFLQTLLFRGSFNDAISTGKLMQYRVTW